MTAAIIVLGIVCVIQAFGLITVALYKKQEPEPWQFHTVQMPGFSGDEEGMK